MDEIEELAEIFKALSDPTRLRLVRLLSDQSETMCQSTCDGQKFLCVNALAHKLGVTQSAVSQHLRILRQAGLVSGERRGSFMHYSIDKEGLAKYKAALRQALGEDLAS
jgi:DNA-binding transcriptional ArsR family regulator